MIDPPPADRINGRDGLRDKKHLLEIDRLAVVPIAFRHRVEFVAVVPAGIVDEDADGAEVGFDGRDRALDVADVTQVGVIEGDRVGTRCRYPFGKIAARRLGDVDEGDARALRGERLPPKPRRCPNRRR